MKQQTLAMAADAQSGFEQHRKPTRRDEFLKTMDALVPWAALCEEIAPHYPKAGNGRPPIGLERMLRIHFIQHWFNLADLACEEALYDSASLRRFVGIDLGCEPVPDATTMLRLRRLLNDNKAKAAQQHTLFGNFRMRRRDTDDIALGDIAVETKEQIGRAEMEEVQRVRLQHLAVMHQPA